ncbi:MAG TPA: Asp-tRNA(Asn)/Glu-tRNA(Gln) amidotransferase subunit GatA [Puia sp.]|nr:Asp-tRNA(Asn)/Glu-tRNA(Gln) amidotransferase subunit GatA [Puia sp.]
MFTFSSIPEYQHALLAGTTTCREAVLYYLDRIRRKQHLNAFVEIYAEEALTRADHLDAKRISGEPMATLHGVVIGIKDVLCYKDHTVTAASHILKGFNPLYTATAVEALLRKEAIILGSLNCDEFAMGSSNENSVYGRVQNALSPERVAGGSSGGSAVAVQAGLCMVSLGSDTGGSVRQPADFCGVIGLKPTYGRVSRYGLIAYASSFDQIGIFGQTIEDLALMLGVIAGGDPMDATSSPKEVPDYASSLQNSGKPRIAVLKEAMHHPSLDPEMREQFLDFINALRADGYEVAEIPFDLLDYVVPAYYILSTAEASSNLSRYDGIRYGQKTTDNQAVYPEFYRKTRSEGFGREVKRRILLGTFVLSAGYYDAYFTRAQQVRKILTERTKLIFNDFDIILTPTVPTTAFRAGEKMTDPVAMYLADLYTVYANLVGIPGISLPLFRHSNGMPFGIQAMTNQFRELSLLQLSYSLMQQYKSYETPTL